MQQNCYGWISGRRHVSHCGLSRLKMQMLLMIALPLSILVALLISPYGFIRVPAKAANFGPGSCKEPIEIIAHGRHFDWHFQYPGPDRVSGTGDDFVLARRLIVPPERDITLRLESEDYIYSFILAELNLIEIAVPEMTHTLTFRAPFSGDFSIPVDSMCSFRPLHADTMGTMIVSGESWQRLSLQ